MVMRSLLTRPQQKGFSEEGSRSQHSAPDSRFQTDIIRGRGGVAQEVDACGIEGIFVFDHLTSSRELQQPRREACLITHCWPTLVFFMQFASGRLQTSKSPPKEPTHKL